MSMRMLGAVVSACLFMPLACERANEPRAVESSRPESVASTPAASTQTKLGPTNAEGPSLVSLSSGAFPIKLLSEYSGAYSTEELLDERVSTNWTSEEGKLGPETLVLALPERTVLESVQFSCGGAVDTCARDLSVGMSDTNPDSGYANVVDVSLRKGTNDQRFAVSAQVPGRWVRLTIQNNHGGTRFIELAEFLAYGKQLTKTPFPDVSGTYDSTLGWMHLKQEGTLVTGCYYTRGGVFEGGIEGRVMKLTWCDRCDTPQKERGPAVLVFAPDGQRFIGNYWSEGAVSGHGSGWDGKRKGVDPGSCPQWEDAPKDVGPAQQQLTKRLETEGRVRVYGINFDSDSDQIRQESIPALENIARMLKAKPEWKLSIEGHTDSTSTPQHNQELSERRAASVKKYLTGAGVDPLRLTTVGYGQDKPVAPNDTALGRSQNRRVELVRE